MHTQATLRAGRYTHLWGVLCVLLRHMLVCCHQLGVRKTNLDTSTTICADHFHLGTRVIVNRNGGYIVTFWCQIIHVSCQNARRKSTNGCFGQKLTRTTTHLSSMVCLNTCQGTRVLQDNCNEAIGHGEAQCGQLTQFWVT